MSAWKTTKSYEYVYFWPVEGAIATMPTIHRFDDNGIQRKFVNSPLGWNIIYAELKDVRGVFMRNDVCLLQFNDISLMMRNGKKNTMDFYTSPQPTNYEKKERNKKKPVTGGEAASAEPVSIEESPCEPPAYEEPPRVIYHSSSGYGWEET